MSKRKKVLATLSVAMVGSLVTGVAGHSHRPWWPAVVAMINLGCHRGSWG